MLLAVPAVLFAVAFLRFKYYTTLSIHGQYGVRCRAGSADGPISNLYLGMVLLGFSYQCSARACAGNCPQYPGRLLSGSTSTSGSTSGSGLDGEEERGEPRPPRKWFDFDFGFGGSRELYCGREGTRFGADVGFGGSMAGSGSSAASLGKGGKEVRLRVRVRLRVWGWTWKKRRKNRGHLGSGSTSTSGSEVRESCTARERFACKAGSVHSIWGGPGSGSTSGSEVGRRVRVQVLLVWAGGKEVRLRVRLWRRRSLWRFDAGFGSPKIV